MSALEPGLYRATVRGVPGESIVMAGNMGMTYTFTVGGDVRRCYVVTDARPLIVLDLTDYLAHTLALDLQQGRWGDIADQIMAQLKPARIEEPGLWGVVRASAPCVTRLLFWVRDERGWATVGDNSFRVSSFDDLIDPTLIREGLS